MYYMALPVHADTTNVFAAGYQMGRDGDAARGKAARKASLDYRVLVLRIGHRRKVYER